MLNVKDVVLALLLGITFGVGVQHASAVPILSINPASQAAQPGQSVSLDVDISGVSDLYAWQFDLTFDPAVLAVLTITEGTFLSSGGSTFFFEGIIDNTGGSLSATSNTLIGAVPGVSGNGTLATIVFQALASGTSPVAFANVILLDSGLADIAANTVDGTINVNASAIPEPATWLLLTTGLVGLLVYGQRWRCAAQV